ncbi:4-hydroxythreonine-4-phosphate dehydrogenase PdxA [Caulobacter sp. 17J80-11]|uniref:4-hydroxythreonine-4-phosphate dehydrogenase PdxA n=1 Tax=Caulobacter sp. 17J80-11 TaxID=2763502 RepID=UPI0016537437|nr:4-hydroxythreonine-4-phosphate dehydrogenase PdxA [Caulobacter sp. 17J80-11]
MTAAPLAVTLGDPAGVGPEIVAKTWSALKGVGPAFVAIGDRDTLAAAMPGAIVERVASLAEGAVVFPKALPVLDPPSTRVCATAAETKARAITSWIETAVALALAGEASGVVTAPISKASLYAGGFKFPGHTEFLADLTAHASMEGARGPVMMLTARDLRVALVTIHTPLRDVPDAVTTERVIHTARVTAEALRRDFGVERPRLALAGLNPHAGESGTIGREEVEVLAPAVAALRAEGIDITDPKPADTLFHDEARRAYDAAVCLYHDQALIPLKTLDFWSGVNVTLGLPIVRTSPDHGTGFDIAGRGIARPDSMIAAVRLAGQIASHRSV